MAKQNVYGEKPNPFLTFIYIVVALALIAALVMMYTKDRDRRRQFKDMVSEAALSEVSLDIASVKGRQSAAAEAIPTTDEAVPTPDEDEPTPTAEPVQNVTAESELESETESVTSLPEIYLPEPEQVQEAISEK